ncbi:DUF1801 domain-containing protein [Candidatus Saccharibacteria bacterium]|nr:DUF1801 domain-containing protein [Candidatus Saccharibacteria bacterium]
MQDKNNQIIAGYLSGLTDGQRRVVEELHGLIRGWQPSLEVRIWHSMGFDIIGYGKVSYSRPGKPLSSWFIIGLAAHKTYFSLYVWGVVDGRYLTEIYADRLGGMKSGKSCLNFKGLAELDLPLLQEVIQRAVEINSSPKPPRKP